ncbi:hypothetical protein HNY73_014589 [Argiope bruennichi]|uniref:Uncharacterized protein n=1 Tax=Argiope bruennichi TaxID=94029 RepID=A0A8T0EPE6_ARGBR|nr:hypothetical protein HNY73_014589 [Argiope bruennichi]
MGIEMSNDWRESEKNKRTKDSFSERRKEEKKMLLKGEAPQLGAKPSGAGVNKHPSSHSSPARTCLHPRRCGMPHGKWIQFARFSEGASSMVRIPGFHPGGPGSIPGMGSVRFHGVMVSTLDFESSDPSSNLGGTLFLI